NALMLRASQAAYDVFEAKLAEREEQGRRIESSRALFDLWIDAAEDAYAEIALSSEFRTVYGKLVNAQMRLRAGVQREVEHASAQFGMPTRTEMDAAHRKIVELERALRKMRDAAETPAPAATRKPPVRRGAKASAAKTSNPAGRPATKQAAAKKPAA